MPHPAGRREHTRAPSRVTPYLARCHCGVLTARFCTAIEPASWAVRACQCRFCRLHDALTASDPAGSLQFRSAQANRVQDYRFGLRTAAFLLCRLCGGYVGAQMSCERGQFGLLNLRALEPVITGLRPARAMSYGSETTEERIRRRTVRWTPIAPGSLELEQMSDVRA
jgi:hypothetical protein